MCERDLWLRSSKRIGSRVVLWLSCTVALKLGPNLAMSTGRPSSSKRRVHRRTGKILLGGLNIICPNETCWSQMHKMIFHVSSPYRESTGVQNSADIFGKSISSVLKHHEVRDKTYPFYTCQIFLRYKRQIFILGVLGILKTTRSFPKIPQEVRSLPKKSEVFRRRPKSSEVLGRV